MNIILRDGASHNDLTIIEGDKKTTIDIAKLDRSGRAKMRRMLISGLIAKGVIKDNNYSNRKAS